MQQKLTVNQKQEQVFTQVQRQSLEILEMSNGQLEEYLSREQMENPVLSVGKLCRKQNFIAEEFRCLCRSAGERDFCLGRESGAVFMGTD